MSGTASRTMPAGSGNRPEFLSFTPYRPRPLRFIERRQLGDWRMKIYGIALAGRAPRPSLVQATIARAAAVLPQPAIAADRYGIGFAIAHDANGVCFANIYWWQSENELHQRLYTSPVDDPAALTPIAHPAAGCVWELGIIDFERRAWLEDVLANPAGADFEGYLARRLDVDL